MNKLRQSALRLLFIMAFVLPLWLTLGRSLPFDVGGWMMLIYIFTLAPAIFVIFLVFHLLLSKRADVKKTKRIDSSDALLLIGLYVSLFLHGLFVVDGGDTAESVNSIASKYLGVSRNVSTGISDTLLLASIVLVAVCLFVFVWKLTRGRSK